jgi:hypothetical protein
VTIVRPHHPLRGRQYDVLKSGKHRLDIKLENGESMYVPRHWTDADGPQLQPTTKEILTVDAIRDLMKLVDSFLRR